MNKSPAKRCQPRKNELLDCVLLIEVSRHDAPPKSRLVSTLNRPSDISTCASKDFSHSSALSRTARRLSKSSGMPTVSLSSAERFNLVRVVPTTNRVKSKFLKLKYSQPVGTASARKTCAWLFTQLGPSLPLSAIGQTVHRPRQTGRVVHRRSPDRWSRPDRWRHSTERFQVSSRAHHHLLGRADN